MPPSTRMPRYVVPLDGTKMTFSNGVLIGHMRDLLPGNGWAAAHSSPAETNKVPILWIRGKTRTLSFARYNLRQDASGIWSAVEYKPANQETIDYSNGVKKIEILNA